MAGDEVRSYVYVRCMASRKRHIMDFTMQSCLRMISQRTNPTLIGVYLFTGHYIIGIQIDDSLQGFDTPMTARTREQTTRCACKPGGLITSVRSVEFNGTCIVSLAVSQVHHLKVLRKPIDERTLNSLHTSILYVGTCTRSDVCAP